MKLNIENFGAIKKRTEIETKPLTIFCGVNNTGKTYALYLLSAALDRRFASLFSSSEKIRELLKRFFVTDNNEFFPQAAISVAYGELENTTEESNRVLLLPAERSGINLFFRELNSTRATLLRHITSQTLDTNELLKEIIVSRYPQPIHDYIEFLNKQPEIKRNTSSYTDIAHDLQKNILKVKYKVDRYGDISIAPSRSRSEMGLHLGSSTVKTFFGLWSYLNHLAKDGDYLMIDEPELNLHPQNQRAIARLLAQLVNRGIRVVVSTHSDYMVREWSNLIMLGSMEFSEGDKLAEKYELLRSQWLKTEQVNAYEFDEGGAKKMYISGDSGIRTDLFDASIKNLNDATQDIYFARQAAYSETKNDVIANSKKLQGQ